MSGPDARLQSYIRRGLAADRPTVEVSKGELYCSTDLDLPYGRVEFYDGSAWQRFGGSAGGSSGAIAQVKNFQTAAVATGSFVIPYDDTIPQNTEGTEFMTLAITPTSASNKLLIEVLFQWSIPASSATNVIAIFQDSTVDALAAVAVTQPTSQGLNSTTLLHYMTAGTTSPTTFKVRAGPAAAGTLTLNGQTGARKLGGVSASSITITEITP